MKKFARNLSIFECRKSLQHTNLTGILNYNRCQMCKIDYQNTTDTFISYIWVPALTGDNSSNTP